MTHLNAYFLLGLAIFAEVVATTSLKATNGLTRYWPIALVVVGYGAAFALLSICLERLPLGFVYSVWAGFGMVGTALVGKWCFDEPLNELAFAAIALIIAGVFLLARAMDS